MSQNKHFLEFESGILDAIQGVHFFAETLHGERPEPLLGSPKDPEKEIAASCLKFSSAL